jgi:raffinose/stachyose/melibiose transport system substrate-binding protein
MKRAISIFLALMLLVSVISLAGCGSTGEKAGDQVSSNDGSSKGAESVKEEAKKDEKVTITILTRWVEETPASKAFTERVKLFQEQNPNITIDNQSINDEPSFNAKLKSGIATDNVPDVFQNYGAMAFKEYVKNGVVQDISKDLEADKEWKDGFLPLFENWQYDDIPGVFGVPTEMWVVGIFYNKELFQKAGLEFPKTISEFMQVCDKFKAAGIIPIAKGDKDVWRMEHLFTNLFYKKFGFQKAKEIQDEIDKN